MSEVAYILGVDDHPVARKTICALLRAQPDFDVICDAKLHYLSRTRLHGVRILEQTDETFPTTESEWIVNFVRSPITRSATSSVERQAGS